MPEFSLYAEDGCVPLDVLEFLALGVDRQMRRDVGPALGMGEPWTVGALPSLDGLADAPGIRKILTFRRKLGVPGAAGFHSERLGVQYAEAMVPRVDGGTIDGTTVSHEVIETFFDPGCDLSFPMPDGSRVDAEICDPVENDSYPDLVRLGADARVVLLSNFVYPTWFGLADEMGSAHPVYDFLNRIKTPFGMTPGGYFRRVNVGGDEEYVYSDDKARASVAAKLSNRTSRLTRRNG